MWILKGANKKSSLKYSKPVTVCRYTASSTPAMLVLPFCKLIEHHLQFKLNLRNS